MAVSLCLTPSPFDDLARLFCMFVLLHLSTVQFSKIPWLGFFCLYGGRFLHPVVHVRLMYTPSCLSSLTLSKLKNPAPARCLAFSVYTAEKSCAGLCPLAVSLAGFRPDSPSKATIQPLRPALFPRKKTKHCRPSLRRLLYTNKYIFPCQYPF